MLVLAVDTSSHQGSVALLEHGEVVAHENWQKGKSHSEVATLMVQRVFQHSQKSLKDVDRLAVGTGPGSFTGLRVGVNLIRSLGFSLQRPIVAMTSLQVLAQPLVRQGLPILSLVNAFKNMVYVAGFTPDGQLQFGPEAWTLPRLESEVTATHFVVGDGFDAYQSRLSPRLKTLMVRESRFSDFPDAIELARLASNEHCPTLDWREVKPLYIRASEAEEKLRAGLLKPLPKI